MKAARVIATVSCLAILSVLALASEPISYAESVVETRPTVDGVNLNLCFLGDVEGAKTFGAISAVTVPIGHRYGLQLDGSVASIDTGAAHFFCRDPSKSLLGAYTNVYGLTTFAAATEGALYLRRPTIKGMVEVTGGC